jgi:hypothetical protein
MPIEIGEYKGQKTITLQREGSRFGFTFGVRKAMLVVENFEAIKKFAKQYADTVKTEKEG